MRVCVANGGKGVCCHIIVTVAMVVGRHTTFRLIAFVHRGQARQTRHTLYIPGMIRTAAAVPGTQYSRALCLDTASTLERSLVRGHGLRR